jgi:peptidoglycan/LPS O-acetylase OafA/YrhL
MKIEFPYCDLLNGLRGFAIVLVLYAHSSLSTMIFSELHIGNGGFVGVDVFFVLSSFLISTLLLKEFLNFGHISIKNFYIRRTIRLLPPLLLSLAIFIPIISIISWKIALKDFFCTLTYSSNVFRSLSHYIPASFQPIYFAHTWSLATEEQFYLLYPFLFLLIITKKIRLFDSQTKLLLTILFIFSLASLFRPVLKDGIYEFPLWRTGEFLIGSLTGLAYANFQWIDSLKEKAPFLMIPQKTLNGLKKVLISPKLTLAVLIISLIIILLSRVNSWPSIVFVHLTISVSTSLLILQSTIVPNKLLRHTFGFATIRKIGTISYGLYLYHYPIAILEGYLFSQRIQLNKFLPYQKNVNMIVSIIIRDGLLVTITLAIALFSYKFIELPALRRKVTFSR